MATLPYDVKTNHMPTAPDGVAWSLSGQPPGTLSIDASGNLTAGVATAVGTSNATVTATIDGQSQTMTVTYVVTEAGATPASAIFASTALNSASSRVMDATVITDVTELVNAVSGEANMTQTVASRMPTMGTYNGADVMVFGNGETLTFAPPAASRFSVTMRLIFDQENTGALSPLVSGGDSANAGQLTNGATSSSMQNAGSSPSVEVFVDGVSIGTPTRDAMHDALYNGTDDAVRTVSIIGIDTDAHVQWDADAIDFFGYGGVAAFAPELYGVAICIYTDSADRANAEAYVEDNDQGVTAL